MTCNRIVVSNTSPVSNLAAVDRLDLLREVFGRVIVPQAVFVECTAAGAGQLVADRIRVQAWIETRDVADRALVTQLRRELDAGEAEAIALAFELKQIGCYFMSGLAVLWQRASVCLSSGYWASSCLLNSAATFPRSSWCLTI